MTPAEQARKAGITLVELSKITGVARRTLVNWHASRPVLFDLMIQGAVFKQAIERVKDNG